MSQISVKVGDRLDKGAVLGRTGTTALAAGDHLHFAINLQGEFVDPLEWWDPHWLKDQVEGVWAGSATAAATGDALETRPGEEKGRQGQRQGRQRQKEAKLRPGRRGPQELTGERPTPSLPGALGPCR